MAKRDEGDVLRHEHPADRYFDKSSMLTVIYNKFNEIWTVGDAEHYPDEWEEMNDLDRQANRLTQRQLYSMWLNLYNRFSKMKAMIAEA